MGRISFRMTWVIVGMALLLLPGCALPPERSIPPVPDQPWTLQNSGAHHSEGEKVFYGIGRATGLRNTTLLRVTADNQARDEMAGLLDHFVMTLATAAGFDSQEEADRQVLHGLTRSALQRARIVAHASESPNNAFLALCRLDLSVFMEVLRTEPQLDALLRNAMLNQAEKVHTRLSTRNGN